MQIKKVVHPEIVLGKRGHPNAVNYYKILAPNVNVDPQAGVQVSVKTPLYNLPHGGENEIEHLILCKLYKQKGKCYYLPKSFAQALSGIDRGIPVSVLPDHFIGYFQFADEAMKDEDGYVDGGYVYIGPANEIGIILKDKEPTTKVIAISYVGFPNSNGGFSTTRFSFEIEGETLADIAAKTPVKDCSWTNEDKDTVMDSRLPVFRALVNAAVYIHTADPDLTRLPAEQELSNKKRSALREKVGAENLCTIPITLVNRNYHEARSFSVDSTAVKGHLRWQPCGPARTQVRLIWIDEHVRTYQ